MSGRTYWLITIMDLHSKTLLKVAVSFLNSDPKISGDCRLYPMEPENRELIRLHLLPDDLLTTGPIVAIEELFDVIVHSA